MTNPNFAIPLTAAEVDVLYEVANAISTENADPVHVPTEAEPQDPAAYQTPSGRRFTLNPLLTQDTFDAFMSLLDSIESRSAARKLLEASTPTPAPIDPEFLAVMDEALHVAESELSLDVDHNERKKA